MKSAARRARPQAQNTACGGNTSSLGGDEVLPIQIEPIAWYPGYSHLWEQSRHKHGNRPDLVVLLHGGSPLWGSVPTPPIKKKAFRPYSAAKLPLGRIGRPCGRALGPCALCAIGGPEHWRPALSRYAAGGGTEARPPRLQLLLLHTILTYRLLIPLRRMSSH